MKAIKLLFVLVILLTVGMSAFAQISFSSWGRVVITPLAFTSNETLGTFSAVSAGTTTWSDAPNIGFSANGSALNKVIGFNIDFDFGYDPSKTGDIKYNIVGDNAKAWVYPLGIVLPDEYNMLKLVAGRFNEDEFRGKIGATEFASWVIPNGSKNEDNLFRRFKASAGAYARLEPLKWWDSPWNKLTLHAVFGSNAIGAPGNSLRAIRNLYNNEANRTDSGYYNPGFSGFDGDRNTSAKDVYRAGQYALGYRIPDIGLARMQFIGNNRNRNRIKPLSQNAGNPVDEEKPLVAGINRGDASSSDSNDAKKNADILEFAFLYDGYQGLRVDAGFKMPLKYSTKLTFTVIDNYFLLPYLRPGLETSPGAVEYAVQLPMIASLGVNWTPAFLNKLNVMTRFDASFGGKITDEPGDNMIENGMTFTAWLVPSYKITPKITLGLDFGIDYHAEDKMRKMGADYPAEVAKITQYVDKGVAPWVELVTSGAKIRTGIVIMMPGSVRYKQDGGKVTPLYLGDPVVSIPISITYSF